MRTICRVSCIVQIILVAQFFSCGSGSNFRIISGRRASTIEFPYQAVLEKWAFHWCGGSIIHKNYVLTAAHCVKANENLEPVPIYILRVRVGSDRSGEDGAVHQISKIMAHKKYSNDAKKDEFDIAVIRLSESLKFGEKVKVVPLAEAAPAEGEMGWVTGYGRQEAMRSAGSSSRHLMAVEIPVVSLENCRKILPNVADDMICAGSEKGNKDACTGDSGGPYVVNNTLVGVVAWGIGCGREGLPGVYTNVAFYRNWIEAKMKLS